MILEVQADKTALDVPSPSAGRVTDVKVKPGDQIKVGQVICLLESGGNGEATKAAAPAKKAEPAAAPPPPKQEAPTRPQPAAPPSKPAAPVVAPVPAVNRLTPAGPSTRRLARELGIDLSQVPGSGRAGRVVEEDVKAYVRQLASDGAAPAVAGSRRAGAAAAEFRGVGSGRAPADAGRAQGDGPPDEPGLEPRSRTSPSTIWRTLRTWMRSANRKRARGRS